MGAEFVFLDFEEEQQDGAATGGYASVSSPEFREAQLKKFREIAPEMDIVISTALIPGRDAPKLWLEDMVASMKAGSVVVDLAAERGGNCDLTVMDEKIVSPNGVTIIGYTDFPSRMGAQSSELYSTNIRHMMADLTPEKDGVINHNMEDDVIRGATITHEGEITFPPPPPKVAAIAAKPKGDGSRTDTRGKTRRRSRSLQSSDQEPGHAFGCWRGVTAGGRSGRPGKLHATLHRLCSQRLHWLPGHLGRRTLAAHAADGCYQRHLIDHHPWRPDANRVGIDAGHHTRRPFSLHGWDKHIRRFPRDTAHARHVPEIVRGRNNGFRFHNSGLCRRSHPLHPVAGRPFGAGKRQAGRLVRHHRHGPRGCRHPDRPGFRPLVRIDHPDLAGRCHRLSAGHQGPDDPDAGTCGCDALTRWSGGCFRRHHRAYRTRSRHGHGRR